MTQARKREANLLTYLTPTKTTTAIRLKHIVPYTRMLFSIAPLPAWISAGWNMAAWGIRYFCRQDMFRAGLFGVLDHCVCVVVIIKGHWPEIFQLLPVCTWQQRKLCLNKNTDQLHHRTQGPETEISWNRLHQLPIKNK